MRVSYFGQALVVGCIPLRLHVVQRSLDEQHDSHCYMPPAADWSTTSRTNLSLVPSVTFSSPLCPGVGLRLELEELCALGLDDQQRKVLERSVDLFLLFGIILAPSANT